MYHCLLVLYRTHALLSVYTISTGMTRVLVINIEAYLIIKHYHRHINTQYNTYGHATNSMILLYDLLIDVTKSCKYIIDLNVSNLHSLTLILIGIYRHTCTCLVELAILRIHHISLPAVTSSVPLTQSAEMSTELPSQILN